MAKVRWTVKHGNVEISEEMSVVDSMSLLQIEEEVRKNIESCVDWYWQIEENSNDKLRVLCFLKNEE